MWKAGSFFFLWLWLATSFFATEALAQWDYEDHWYYSHTGAGSQDNQYRDLFGDKTPAGGSFGEVLSKAQIVCNTFVVGAKQCNDVTIEQLDESAACPSIPGWSGGCRRLRVCLRIPDSTSCFRIAFFSRHATCGTFSSEDGTCSNFPGVHEDQATCEAAAGKEERISYPYDPDAPSPSTYCASPEGTTASCALTVGAVRVCLGGACAAGAKYTGSVCEVGSDTPEPPHKRPGPGEVCISSGGLRVCGSTSSERCGTVNGGRWCIDQMAADGCVFVGRDMVCEDGVGAPPAPSNPEGNAPATPDGTFTAAPAGGEERTYNYYSETTINNSGTVVVGGGSGTGEGSGVGGGDGDGEGMPGECELFAQTLCDIYGWFTDEGEEPEHPEMPTLDEPEPVAFDGSFGAAACPAPIVFSLAGYQVTIPFDALCDLAWLFYGLIMFSAALTSAGILLGLRV